MLERAHILICGGTGCTSGNSKVIFNEFQRLLEEKGIREEIKLNMNEYMELRFKKSYAIATLICEKMEKILGTKLHENELGYLAMHIQRCIEEIESE